MTHHPKESMNCGRVVKEWNEISLKVCQNLIESMPRQIQAVIKANGGHTKYYVDSEIIEGQKTVQTS